MYRRPMNSLRLLFVAVLLSACGSDPVASNRADSALDAPEVLDAGARDDSQDADDVVMFDAGPLGMDAPDASDVVRVEDGARAD
jgi:hypothetical protein